jgi:UDP-2,3-diacylglucosamine pyrophosphatase LpxH
MPWKLATPDNIVTLNLNAADNGAMNGTLTYQGISYDVAGGWDAAGSIPGRNYSAFSVSGRTPGPPDVPNWIAAAGIMTGPGNAPSRIDIRVGVSSAADGTLVRYSGVLFPSAGAGGAKSKIVVISDVHIGIDARTNWYQSSVHEPYLAAILNWIIANAAQIREVVLLGDIVDFWTYPSDTQPPDVDAIVAAQPALFGPSGLFGKVAAALPGAVHYVVGNHDIGITAADVAKLTPPNAPIAFEPGTVRLPLGNSAVVLTHGSEYVLFNAQDNAARNPHAPLPLGHFITRSAATYFAKKGLQPGQTVADLPNVGTPLNAGFFAGFGGLVGSLSDSANWQNVSAAQIMLDYVIGTMELTPADVSPFTLPGGAVATIAGVYAAYDSLFADWVERKGLLGAVAAVRNDLNEVLDDYGHEAAATSGASVVVMGHTHTAKNTPFSTDFGQSVYVNSGFECASLPDLPQKPPTFAVVDVGDTSITTSIFGATKSGNQISIGKLLPDCSAPYAPGRKRSWSPKSLLASMVDLAGFTYDPEQDIIVSKMDPLQRKFGYAYGYDAAALLMSAVIDCEPIFFDYNNKHWMIELWKGQYGLMTGCEIGVYTRSPGASGFYSVLDATLGPRAHDANPTHNLFYDCAADSDRLAMSYTLFRGNNKATVFTRKEQHWWLTGFKWGVLSTPDDLTMDVSIDFGNAQMLSAFVSAARALGYQGLTVSGTAANFTFAKPFSPQPRNEPGAASALAAANTANAAIVTRYQSFKLPTNDPNTIADNLADSLATYILMYPATYFAQTTAALFEKALEAAQEAVDVLTGFFGLKADTAAQLVTFGVRDFTAMSGENSSATSAAGLAPYERVRINGSTDLSSCIKANNGGCVYGISLNTSSGMYGYTVTVDAQGPSGWLSGSMYLAFTDQTGDVYRLSIFRSDRTTHTVSYNSAKPAIVKIQWNNTSI